MVDRHVRAYFKFYPSDHDGPPRSEEEWEIAYPDGAPYAIKQFDDGTWVASHRDATGMGREIKVGSPDDDIGRSLAWLVDTLLSASDGNVHRVPREIAREIEDRLDAEWGGSGVD